MELAMIVFSLLSTLPAPKEATPERTVQAIAAYVRTVALKKRMNPSKAARALGIEQCTAGSGSGTGRWICRQDSFRGGYELMVVLDLDHPIRDPRLTNWY